jgi:hypothetical protein
MLVNPTTLADHPDATASGKINNDLAKAAIWAFFESNPDRVILKVAFLKVRVRDLRVLFELLAGPEPL